MTEELNAGEKAWMEHSGCDERPVGGYNGKWENDFQEFKAGWQACLEYMENKPQECPFKVGDRIRNKFNGLPAIVTAVTKEGFEWKLDKPQTFIAREGSWYEKGTCYPTGFENYELINLYNMKHLSIEDLFNEIIDIHQDPTNPEYNKCDVAPCFWCQSAKNWLAEYKKNRK